MKRRYDIAVAGGGLAGLALAIQAARKGHEVILFEKEDYPRHKVCGEYVSLESKPFLEQLGLALREWELPVITRLQMTDVKGNIFSFPLDMGGFGISRYKLDEALYQLALQAGATVLTRERVQQMSFLKDVFQVETLQATVEAGLVFSAAGKRSNLDVKWKRPFTLQKPGKRDHYVGVKYHIRYPWPPDMIGLHNFPGGYCGISAVEDGICCLCYLTAAENLSASGNSIAAMEEKVLYKNPVLREIFRQSHRLWETPLTISQISFSPKNQVEAHVLMLGDAAGMITPLCGNGMSMALHSSLLAFEEADRFLKGQQDREQLEQAYTRRWKKLFSTRLAMGRTVQQFTGQQGLTSGFLHLMKQLPPLARLVIKQTHGNVFGQQIPH